MADFSNLTTFDQQQSVIKQKEADLKDMQEQLESYNQMVNQLSSQREMATKMLADMDAQIDELKIKLESERSQVEAKDKELQSKRTQLQLLTKFEDCKKKLSLTTENLSKANSEESQLKSKLYELRQFLTLTNATLDDIEKAISIQDTIQLSTLCNQMLQPPLSINNSLTNGSTRSDTKFQTENHNDQLKISCFNNNVSSMFGNSDPFADEDPFDGDDPFKAEDQNYTLPPDDPFNPNSGRNN